MQRSRRRLRVGSLDRLVSAVEVEVVGLHAGHDGHVGLVDEERPVALIGFGHEDVTRAEVGVGAVLGQLTSDGERRVDSAGLQSDGEHRRRRGLAVGAGDRDPSAPRMTDARACDRCRTRSPRARAARSSTLSSRMAEEIDDGVGAAEMGGVVADVDLRPFGGQGRQHERVLGVGPTDGHPPGKHHPGDTGHPRATDGYEVDRAQTAGGRDLGGEVEATGWSRWADGHEMKARRVRRPAGRSSGTSRVRGKGDQVGQPFVGLTLSDGCERRRPSPGSVVHLLPAAPASRRSTRP